MLIFVVTVLVMQHTLVVTKEQEGRQATGIDGRAQRLASSEQFVAHDE